MKKLFCGLLCLVLALSALASVAMAETAAGSVRILANVTGGKDEEEMVLWAQALSEADVVAGNTDVKKIVEYAERFALDGERIFIAEKHK